MRCERYYLNDPSYSEFASDMRRQATLKPRKTPRQTRSAATVEAIFEATIQVLLTVGASRLTTTRVAERAGVSVGTMYQYFPHKQALLYAVLQQHLEELADSVESACLDLHGRPLAELSDGLVKSYLHAKTCHIDASRALYGAASELDAADLGEALSRRINAAIRALLASASDASFENLDAVTFTLQQALSGTVRAVFESASGPTADSLNVLSTELPLLCKAYLASVSQTR